MDDHQFGCAGGNCEQPERCGCGACAEEDFDDDCECGCGCEGGGAVVITTDDGRQLQCNIITVFGVAETDYIALQPVGSDELLIFRYIEGEDGEVQLDNIRSDEEFDLVSNAFKGLFENDDFADDDFCDDFDDEPDDEFDDFEDFSDEDSE